MNAIATSSALLALALAMLPTDSWAAANSGPPSPPSAWRAVKTFDLSIDEILDGMELPEIIGGQPSTGDPAVPAILFLDDAGNAIGICSGSLIDARHVLTAAHCVDGQVPVAGYAVYFGTTVLGEDAGYITHTFAERVAFHDRWDPNDLENGHDIGVIQLVDAVPIEPLAYNRMALSPSDVGAPLRLVGWGITGSGNGDEGLKRTVASVLAEVTDLFAAIEINATGSCNGDSGGPMLIGPQGNEIIIGVTSFGDTDCLHYVAYTRVDLFANWVANLVGGGEPPEPGDPPSSGGTGQFGDACTSGADCASGLCAQGAASGFCTAECTGPSSCPDGYTCEPVEGGIQACLEGAAVASTGPTVTPKEAGGCSATGNTRGPLAFALAVLLMAVRRRRTRGCGRRSTPGSP